MSSFFAMLSRIKYIRRWGLMRSAYPETLSEHSLETAMLTHALIAIGNERLGKNLNPEKGAMIAMYHDCSEILTGDLPTPVKYKNEAIVKAYKEIEDEANKSLLSLLPSDLLPQFEKYFFPKDNFPEFIPYVKAADKLSAIIKCLEEKQAGNKEFDRAFQTLFSHESLNLPEAKIFIEEFLPAFSKNLDDLS